MEDKHRSNITLIGVGVGIGAVAVILLLLLGARITGLSIGGVELGFPTPNSTENSSKPSTPLVVVVTQPSLPTVIPTARPTVTPLPTSQPPTSVSIPVRWLQETSQVPESGTQLTWELSGGQVMFLSGGQFQIGDVFCGGDARQICVLIYQASTHQTVTINALVPRQNYIGITESLSSDEALEEKEPLFWIPPNCVSGCQRATVLFFEDGELINKVSLTAP